jgi:hypothetical protein
MTEQRELSASALQILEKKQRIERMVDLATQITSSQLKEILEENPNLSETQLIERLKQKGILKYPFLHEYIVDRSSVELKTAKGYYAHLTQRLKPTFFEHQNGEKKTYFHLSDSLLRIVIRETKGKTEESQ